MSELIIDESNFNEYFRDVRHNKPQKGEIMVKWFGRADFVEGDMKKNVISLLKLPNKVESAIKVMQNLGHSTEKDAIRLCKDMCSDLANGMSIDEVEKKNYSYNVEFFYYTKKEYVPLDDPHWEVISLVNLDEFLDMAGNRLKIDIKYEESKTEELRPLHNSAETEEE